MTSSPCSILSPLDGEITDVKRPNSDFFCCDCFGFIFTARCNGILAIESNRLLKARSTGTILPSRLFARRLSISFSKRSISFFSFWILSVSDIFLVAAFFSS